MISSQRPLPPDHEAGHTSKSNLLLIGIIFGVFLGPDEHVQISESPVARGQ